jgi:hypothetical protein
MAGRREMEPDVRTIARFARPAMTVDPRIGREQAGPDELAGTVLRGGGTV